MEFIGTGGAALSLGLSLYNTNEIMSIKSDLESLIKSDKIDIEAPKPVPPVVTSAPIPVTEASTVSETIFKDSESDEINELQASVKELEIFANTLSTQASTNSSNISIKSDEIENLNVFVGNQFIDVRGRIAVTEDSISSNLSQIEKIDTEISDIKDASLVTNDRIDANVTSIESINASADALSTRVTSAEGNILSLSNDLTERGLDIDSLGDELGLQSNLLGETQLSLDNMYSLWNGFNEIAFVAEDILNVSSMAASNCNLAFKHNSSDVSALHWVSDLNSTGWVSYLASPSGKSPDGDAPRTFGSVSSWAVRTRIGAKSSEGWMLENNSGAGIMSVSSTGVLDLGQHSRMTDLYSNAYFGHRDQYNTTGFSLIQNGSGKTQVNSASGQDLNLCSGGSPVLVVTGEGGVDINNSDDTYTTHFNHKNTGNNFIRSTDFTQFSFGKNSPSVSVTDKEVTIDGTSVKATLSALEARIAALEAKDYILNGDQLRIRNGNNNNLLRKASSNNSAIMDSTSKDSRSLWTVTHV